MDDLNQEELGVLRLSALTGTDVVVNATTLGRLLDMATRSVSEETVHKLARYQLESSKKDAGNAAICAWNEFTAGCAAELRRPASKVTVASLTGPTQ